MPDKAVVALFLSVRPELVEGLTERIYLEKSTIFIKLITR